jgi:hypothetical protein
MFTGGPLRPLPSSPFGLRAPGEGRVVRVPAGEVSSELEAVLARIRSAVAAVG